MSIKHIPDGGDFEFSRDFGFSGSAPRRRFAEGGHVRHHEGHEEHHATGGEIHPSEYGEGGEPHGHPHGHHVVHVEHHADGGVTHHHDHGGFTHHHPDGQITHHDARGGACHARGGMEGMHDTSEYAHRAKGGHNEAGEEKSDEAQDKGMIKKAFREHDQHMHEGHHEDIELAHGGHALGGRQLPGMRRGMPPAMGRPGGMDMMPPRPRSGPPRSPTGGMMPYGQQPSTEPGGGDIPQMSKGGHRKPRG